MSAAFSSNESTSLEQAVDIDYIINNLDEIWTSARSTECINWIIENHFKKVCLQFPDNLLCYSTHIATDLKTATNVDVYILGDTSYGSCCVDETAASHVDADSIIHFGHACLSKATRLPLYYVFPNYKIDTKEFVMQFTNMFPNSNEKVALFYNVGYFYEIESIKHKLSSYDNIIYGKLAVNEEPDMLGWHIGQSNLKNCTCVYLGKDDRTFFVLALSLKATNWLIYDPSNDQKLKEINPMTTNWMRRRYFYIEKCKDAQSIGIVVGTLTAKGYLDMVKHIQTLARKRGVRTYLFSVGKVNPSKLANFMDIDCFVLIGCFENNLFTSRDFYKPLLSVFEVEMALNPAWHEQFPENYCVDYTELLPAGKLYREFDENKIIENDVSLVTGRVRTTNNDGIDDNGAAEGVLQEKKNHQVALSNSSSSFQNRSWTGLDPSLGKTAPAAMKQGRTGIAIKYSDDGYSNN